MGGSLIFAAPQIAGAQVLFESYYSDNNGDAPSPYFGANRGQVRRHSKSPPTVAAHPVSPFRKDGVAMSEGCSALTRCSGPHACKRRPTARTGSV